MPNVVMLGFSRLSVSSLAVSRLIRACRRCPLTVFKSSLSCVLVLTFAACASKTPGPTAVHAKPESANSNYAQPKAPSALLDLAAEQARTDASPTEAERLDIGIVAFDPGIPEDITSHRVLGVFPLIRKAESRYLPFLLRQTLDNTGEWGVVRVMPKTYQSSELLIRAHIIESTGEVLALNLQAEDSAGRLWLDQTYKAVADEGDYQQEGKDPFQALFSQIAEDLRLARARLTLVQLESISQVATLRYGAEMSPETFNEFLLQDEEGVYQLNRLPAEGDPMLERIRRIRQYEHLFIDTADEQYLALFGDMTTTYTRWRQYSRELSLYVKDYEHRAADKDYQFRRGSFGSMTEVYANYEWFRRQEQHMEELAGGFNNEVVPTVMQLDDSVVQLSGDMDAQYTQWRSILRSLFELERMP